MARGGAAGAGGQATKAVNRAGGQPRPRTRTRPPARRGRRAGGGPGERRCRAPRSAGSAMRPRAFERERYVEVTRLLRPLADQAPKVAAVRELLGLAFYRQGKWTEAVGHLEAYRPSEPELRRAPGAGRLSPGPRALGRGGGDSGRSCVPRRPAPRSSPRAGSSPPAPSPTKATCAPRSGCSRRGPSRRGRSGSTCGSGTRWPTSTSGRATCPRRAELFRRILERDPSFADVVERAARRWG